jgi:hypothetical protein
MQSVHYAAELPIEDWGAPTSVESLQSQGIPGALPCIGALRYSRIGAWSQRMNNKRLSVAYQ